MVSADKGSKNIVFFAFLLGLGVWVFVFWGHFNGLVSKWNSDDYSYCYLVPLVFLWLLYESKKEILQSTGGRQIFSYVFIVGAVFLYLAGKFSGVQMLIHLSMWSSFAALLLALLGDKSIRTMWFPLFILIFSIPAPPFVTNVLSFKLKILSSVLSAKLLNFLSIPVYQEGNIIDLGVVQLQVVDACSGLRYFVPTVLIALLLAHFFLKKKWHKWLLVIISPFVAIASNVLRITITGILVRFVSPALGEGFFHDFSGWLVYMANIAFLGVILLVLRRFFRFGSDKEKSAPAPEEASGSLPSGVSHVVALLILAVVLLGAGMLQGNFLVNQITPHSRPLKEFPINIGDWKGQQAFLDKATLESLWADDYFMGRFKNEDTGNVAQVLIPYYNHQTVSHTAHAPTSCLLGSGWTIVSKEELPPAPDNGRPFPVSRMLLTKGDYTIISYFWFSQRGRHITNEWLNKFYLTWDAFMMHRTDGALIRIEMVLVPGQTLEQGEKVMDSFSGEISAQLKKFLPQRELREGEIKAAPDSAASTANGGASSTSD